MDTGGMNTPEPLKPEPAGAVTKASYFALARAHMRASGRRNKDHPTIYNALGAHRKGIAPTIEQWIAWMTFFKKIGLKTKPLEVLGWCVVPTIWPWEFSLDAAPIEARLDQLVAEHRASILVPMTEDERERMRERFRDLLRDLKSADVQRRSRVRDGRDRQAVPSYPPTVSTAPVTLSEEAMRIFRE